LYGIAPFDPRKQEDQNPIQIEDINQDTRQTDKQHTNKIPEIKPDDLVYVQQHKPGKLSIKWDGPYKVIKTNEGKTVITMRKKNGKILQRNLKQIRLCPKVNTDSTSKGRSYL